MAQSRTNSKSKFTKKSKSNVPKWAIAAVVVLVVAVAGYAIVRFSQAGTIRENHKRKVGNTAYGYYTYTKDAGTYECDDQQITKNNIKYCILPHDKKVDIVWGSADQVEDAFGGSNKGKVSGRFCGDIGIPSNTQVKVKYIYNLADTSNDLEGSYVLKGPRSGNWCAPTVMIDDLTTKGQALTVTVTNLGAISGTSTSKNSISTSVFYLENMPEN